MDSRLSKKHVSRGETESHSPSLDTLHFDFQVRTWKGIGVSPREIFLVCEGRIPAASLSTTVYTTLLLWNMLRYSRTLGLYIEWSQNAT